MSEAIILNSITDTPTVFSNLSIRKIELDRCTTLPGTKKNTDTPKKVYTYNDRRRHREAKSVLFKIRLRPDSNCCLDRKIDILGLDNICRLPRARIDYEQIKRVLPIKVIPPKDTFRYCQDVVTLSATLEYGNLNDHTIRWEQIHGEPVIFISGQDELNLVINRGVNKDEKMFRLFVDKGRATEESYDVFLSGTPYATLSGASRRNSVVEPPKLNYENASFKGTLLYNPMLETGSLPQVTNFANLYSGSKTDLYYSFSEFIPGMDIEVTNIQDNSKLEKVPASDLAFYKNNTAHYRFIGKPDLQDSKNYIHYSFQVDKDTRGHSTTEFVKPDLGIGMAEMVDTIFNVSAPDNFITLSASNIIIPNKLLISDTLASKDQQQQDVALERPGVTLDPIWIGNTPNIDTAAFFLTERKVEALSYSRTVFIKNQVIGSGDEDSIGDNTRN